MAFTLQLPESLKIHPTSHLSLLKLFVNSSFPDWVDHTPLPLIVHRQEEYKVHQVRRKLQYLIHWNGYRPEELSWEPEENAQTPYLMQEFLQTYPGKPGPRGFRRSPLEGDRVLSGTQLALGAVA